MGRILDELCGIMTPTLLETLAACIVKNDAGYTFLNVICYNDDCADLSSAAECGDSVQDAEAFIIQNAFGVDDCGNLALKLRVCVDADAENGGGGPQ